MHAIKQKIVGILIFDDVEVLDFTGPFEVFSLAENVQGEKLFKVITLARDRGKGSDIILARNGLKVIADYYLDTHPHLDVLVIPGGHGAETVVIKDELTIDWITQTSKQVDLTLSICTGAFLLAKAGLLSGKKATTHWMDIEKLASDFTDIEVLSEVSYVDASDEQLNIVTSAGISAGINASLYCVSKLASVDIANETAKRMEYEYRIENS